MGTLCITQVKKTGSVSSLPQYALLVLVLLLIPMAAAGLPAYSVSDCCSGYNLPALDSSTSKSNHDSAHSVLVCNYNNWIPPSQKVYGTGVVLIIGSSASAAEIQQIYDQRAQAVRTEYNQMTQDQKSNLYQYLPPGPDMFSRVVTRITPELGREWAGERWQVYKSVNYITIIAVDSTKSGSPQQVVSMMDTAEACGKKIIDRNSAAAGSATSGSRGSTSPELSSADLPPGSSGSAEVMMNYVNPPSSGPSLDDLDDLPVPYEESTASSAASDSSGDSAALGAVVLLGGAAAAGYVGIKILGAGATKAAGGAAAGSQAASPGTGPVTGGERSAADVVAAGTTGPTQLERLAMDIGDDTVDRLGEGPGTDRTDIDPEETRKTAQAAGDDLIRDLENDPEVVKYKQDLVNDLTGEMKDVVRKMTADGLRVQNPFLTQKDGWVDSALDTIRDAGALGELEAGLERGASWVGSNLSVSDYRRYGKCTEFTTTWGIPYAEERIRKVFGRDTYIGQVVINEDIPEKNHTAIQIITPAGDRYVVDLWEAMQKTNQDPVNNPAKEIRLEVRTEDAWVQQYREKFKTPHGQITYDNDQEAVRKYFRSALPARGSTMDPSAGFDRAAKGFMQKPGDFYLKPGTERSMMNGLDKIRRDGGSL